MENYAKISIRESGETKVVKIASDGKPDIPDEVTQKWQSLIDTAAKIAAVPAGLIMRLNKDNIEVFLKSDTADNPYEAGETEELIYGLYCESVIGTQKPLIVPDATKSTLWKHNNPDVEINMISYMGYPINWPDGEVFGTVCLLDKKHNKYSKEYGELLQQISQHIETDLSLLIKNQYLEQKTVDLINLNHTKTRFLSVISHDLRGRIGTLEEFLKLISSNFHEFETERLKSILKSLSKDASFAFQTLENILNWSKNSLSGIKPDFKETDVTYILDNLHVYFQQSIELKNLIIKKNYSATKPVAYTDRNMLTVILRNIISNAIKFSQNKGEIHFGVYESGKDILLEVKDHGIGMDNSIKEKLFKAKSGETEKGTNNEDGAGIGLMLTREFLDKINATVEVVSEPDKGTSFRITLPRRVSEKKE